MIKKKVVKKNFSNGAETYDEYATVQKHMANKLINYFDDRKIKKLYEIGCGTGIYSSKIVEKKISKSYHLIDISDKMLSECKIKMINYDNIEYSVGDAEEVELKDEEYDIITSNAVFQWFSNIELALNNYCKALKSGGELIFSIFAKDTYRELKEVFNIVDENSNYSQEFITREKLETIFNGFCGKYSLEEEYFIEKFDTVMDFFKQIKSLGTNSAIGKRKVMTPLTMKKIEKNYKERYSLDDKIVVTNHLIYIKFKKS